MAKGNKRLSIAHLAQELGLSASTISRALNNAPDVSEATKAQVWALAEKLHYQPNGLAAALRRGRSNVLGVIVPHITGAFFPAVVHGMEEEASKEGFNVMVCQTSEEVAREKKQVEVLLKGQVDGILVAMSKTTHDFAHFERVRSQNIPLVFFDRIPDLANACAVVSDDYRGAYQAVEHLIKQGCRRIAHMAGHQTVSTTHNRYRAYRDALAAHGLPYEEALVIHLPNPSTEAGAQAMATLLQQPVWPDAVFAAYDFPAVGALEVLDARGIRVPEDIALVGYSNEPFTTMLKPRLTSVDQRAKQMGEAAIQLFLQLLKRPGYGAGQRITLKPQLLIRESSLQKSVFAGRNERHS